MFITWWLFVQVLTSFYTPQLTAYLTLSDTTPPIKSLQDLSNSPDAKWISVSGNSFQGMVEVSFPSFSSLGIT